MNQVNVVTVCDSCGREDTQPQKTAQPPKGWREVTAKPLGGADGVDTNKRWDLCPSCSHEMDRLLATKPTVLSVQDDVRRQLEAVSTGSPPPGLVEVD